MTENTNPGAMSPGSEPVDTPMTIDDAVASVHDDPGDPVSDTVDDPAIDGKGEPDDFALSEGEEEAEGQQDEAETPEPVMATDEMVVKVDGENIPVSELKKRHLLESDYTRGKQAIAQERGQLRELGTHFSAAMERITDYLVSKLPPEPDPQLAFTNPNEHYQRKVLHDAAYAEMMQVLQVQQGAEKAVEYLDDNQFKALMSDENAKIVRTMPHLKDAKRMDAFNRSVLTGAKAYGFTEEEVGKTADSRLRLMAYDAAYGREARANAQRAKAKVQAAPKMLPAQRAQHPNSVAALERNNAMRRLEATGSINDAVKALMAGQQ